MRRGHYTHSIDDICDDCNDPSHFRSRNGGALAKFVPGKFAAAPETYEILTFGRPIRNRKLTWVSANDRAFKEAIIMLDVAFVALGLAALALMGVYALALIQL
jgi:hypothetical protein